MKIYKYPLPVIDLLTLTLPEAATVLCVQIQSPINADPQIWVLVNETAPLKTRNFRWFGTGHSIQEPERLVYIGTIQMMGGLVFHLFEELA